MLQCPSSRCRDDAILLGVVGPDGRVGYITPEMRVDAAFVEQAEQGRRAEKRFRFAGPCVEHQCRQWTGSRCGVIDDVLEHVTVSDGDGAKAKLARCAIRPHCRWFAQSGIEACRVCPLVITDLGGD